MDSWTEAAQAQYPATLGCRRAAFRGLRQWLVLAAACASACNNATDWEAATIDDGARRWASVYRGADYRVFVDTATITPRPDRTYEVWYRTDHRVPHLRHGKHWNREVTRALVSCEERRYKVISADLSLGDNKPISRQRASPREVFEQEWREVAVRSVDEATLIAACAVAPQRRRPRQVGSADRSGGQ